MAHSSETDRDVDTIRSVLTKIFTTQEKIEMNELNSTGLDKISIYLALLFLTADDRVDLQQDEFYSDLYIVPSNNLNSDDLGVILWR